MKSCSAISGAIWDRMRGARGAPLVSIVLILLMSLTFPAVHGQSSRTSKLSADMDSPTTLNVHVVPHTHDDVGWLKTVEQYYYGENMTIQHACVSDILDSVVSSLVENPSRTFTYVEQKFFSMWWNEQDNAVKETVRFLVANQQLSFVNGGWCMHDEAAAHFIGMIDQTTLGHQFLLKELGVVPKVGWQLDPFGHSASQASLFASKVGFDALYIGRIDHQDLEIRHYTQECEGLWNSSNSLEDTTIFWGLTGSYEGNYNPPRGYCFDIGCDDPLITDYNKTELERSMHIFLERLRIQSDRTKGNHIMITMGSDFQYQRAHINYANLDLLISEILEMQRLNLVDIPALFGPRFEDVNIFYSSPDYYTKCKYEELKSSRNHSDKTAEFGGIKLSTKTDDFMPYSDCNHCFWTGYFTSRAGLKRLERVASAFLLAARQIETIFDATAQPCHLQCGTRFHELEDASGVAQHHDGVSGTSKQHVAYDYAKRLQSGIDGVSLCTTTKLRHLLLGVNESDYLTDMSFCQLLNETKCEVSQAATMSAHTRAYVVVYNGLAQPRSSIVHLPVSSKAMYSVQRVGAKNRSSSHVEAIPEFASAQGPHGTYRVVFSTGILPPLGANVFEVSLADVSSASMPSMKSTDNEVGTERLLQRTGESSAEIIASNEFFSVTFNGSTGSIKNMTAGNVSMELESLWGYYTSFNREFDAPINPDNNPASRENQNSGAYIFRPSTPDQQLKAILPVSAVFYNTTVGTEVHTTYELPWIRTVTRVLVGQPYLEVEYTVGPVPIDDMIGKEVVTRLSSPIRNSGTFFTDSNGREFMKRQRNFRPTWNLNVYEPVAGNYYPVNAAMFIEDEGRALAIANDRSQGGSSIQDGTLELMVHRRTLVDDERGVSEPINETDAGITAYPPYGNATRMGDGIVIKGKHFISIGSKGGAALARSLMDPAFVEPLVFVGSATADQEPPLNLSMLSGISTSLPSNVMLLTRYFYNGNTSMLLRLAHQYGLGEDPRLSKAVEVDLAMYVPGYEIVNVTEVTLSANQEYDSWEKNRIDWTISNTKKVMDSRTNDLTGTKVELSPMDIRTFVVSLK